MKHDYAIARREHAVAQMKEDLISMKRKGEIKTYNSIPVKQLQHNMGWIFLNLFHISIDGNIFINQRLIPGWAQCLYKHFRRLARVTKSHTDVWI